MSRFLGIVALILSFALPYNSQAYFVTDTNQFSLDGSVGVFTIDYAFGHEKYDLTMPLRAVRGVSDIRDVLTYDVIDGEGNPGKGTAYGVILSPATLKEGHYVVPKGKALTFRLLVLYTRDASEGGKLFRTQVTGLPFAFSHVQDLSLTSSELRKYVTAPLPFLESVSVEVTSSTVK